MAQQTLQQLYQAQPWAKAAIEKAAGYAVFSDMGFKILFGGSGNGQGVIVNNQTKKQTYMKMIELLGGLGFGISKVRNVFVFTTKGAMDSFMNSGWQFGGQATAGAKTWIDTRALVFQTAQKPTGKGLFGRTVGPFATLGKPQMATEMNTGSETAARQSLEIMKFVSFQGF